MALIEKLTNIADGFRTSRSLTQKLSLDEMAELAAVPIGGGENKFAQLVNKTITEVTAEDLEGVKRIEQYAFLSCENLISVTIPDSVEFIGYSAFGGNKNLLPDRKYYFNGDLAFYCGIEFNNEFACPFSHTNKVYIQNALGEYEPIGESPVIPNHATKINKCAFMGADITSIEIGNGVESIGESAFRKSSLNSVTIPDNVTQMSSWVFANCNSLTDVVIGKNVNVIDEYAFYECKNLTTVTINDGNEQKKIYENAFKGCEKLINIKLPDTLYSIPEYCFDGCKSLTNITLPDSIETIGAFAFDNCPMLTSLTIPANVASLHGSSLRLGSSENKATITFLRTTPPTLRSTSVFKTEYLEKIIVPAGSGEAYKTATNWSNLADYIEEAAE